MKRVLLLKWIFSSAFCMCIRLLLLYFLKSAKPLALFFFLMAQKGVTINVFGML